MIKITDLHHEAENVIKQKYGLDTHVATPILHEHASGAFYSTLIAQPGKDTLVVMVAVLPTPRGFNFQVFEHVHQVFMPH